MTKSVVPSKAAVNVDPYKPLGSVEDLIVEYREVESQTKSDRMSGGEIAFSDIYGCLVGHQTVLCCLFPLITGGKLSQVSVVISLPVKHAGTYRTNIVTCLNHSYERHTLLFQCEQHIDILKFTPYEPASLHLANLNNCQ